VVEVERSRVGKKGVVRDTYDQAGAIFQVLQTQQLGWQYRSLTWSPVTGPAGGVSLCGWEWIAKHQILI